MRLLREDRISQTTLKEQNIYDFKDWEIYFGNSNLENSKDCGIEDCHWEDFYWDYALKNAK